MGFLEDLEATGGVLSDVLSGKKSKTDFIDEALESVGVTRVKPEPAAPAAPPAAAPATATRPAKVISITEARGVSACDPPQTPKE